MKSADYGAPAPLEPTTCGGATVDLPTELTGLMLALPIFLKSAMNRPADQERPGGVFPANDT